MSWIKKIKQNRQYKPGKIFFVFKNSFNTFVLELQTKVFLFVIRKCAEKHDVRYIK